MLIELSELQRKWGFGQKVSMAMASSVKVMYCSDLGLALVFILALLAGNGK